VPTVELPPAVEFTLQVTLVLDVPVTVAVNCCVAPVCALAEVGDIVTITEGGGVIEEDGPPPQPVSANAITSRYSARTRAADP
jgi:hypothetical protein